MMHAIIIGCSGAIVMNLTVCKKQVLKIVISLPQAALHIHNPDLMEGINGFVTAWHALATKSHCHVLRLVFYPHLKGTQLNLKAQSGLRTLS